MSKDVLRCDSLQFSLHNLQISLSLCSYNEGHLGTIDRFASLRQYAESMAFALDLILPAKAVKE